MITRVEFRDTLIVATRQVLEFLPNAYLFYDDMAGFIRVNNHRNLPYDTCAALFAVLSANTGVDANRQLYLLYQERGILAGQNRERAVRLLNGESVFRIPSKTYAFYRNLCMDTDYITVDRWILRLHGVNPHTFNWNRDYSRMHSILYPEYRYAGSVLGLTPYEVQSALWAGIRSGILPYIIPIPVG